MPERQVPEGVEFLEDVSPARWIQDTLWPLENAQSGRGWRVGSLVPEGFSSYGRVLHPANYETGDGFVQVRWSTVASWFGRTVHPRMRFWRIANLPKPHRNPDWGRMPEEGSLPPDECRVITKLLGEHTSTPDRCYFCIWEGFGFIDRRLFGDARVRFPQRGYLLFRGPLDAVFSLMEMGYPMINSPNIWWPEDRAWCVATDIDSDSTYVGGTDDCIQSLRNCPDLEALPADIEGRMDFAGDTIDV